MKQIINLLDWTELEYHQFVYETGLAYLRVYIPGDTIGIAALERSRIYWNWWKNHWRQRDEKFLSKVNPSASVNGIREYYYYLNDPRRLTNEVYPNAAILNESYAVMIGEFNNSIK